MTDYMVPKYASTEVQNIDQKKTTPKNKTRKHNISGSTPAFTGSYNSSTKVITLVRAVFVSCNLDIDAWSRAFFHQFSMDMVLLYRHFPLYRRLHYSCISPVILLQN